MRRSTTFAVVAILLAACGTNGPRAESDLVRYRDPQGRFSLAHPRGWTLTLAQQDGVSFWRWTPEPLASPDASASADLMFALVPLPPIPEARLGEESLEEVGEYVRDILVMSAREEGREYRSSAGRRLKVGGKSAIRFDLTATGPDGGTESVSAIVVNADGSAAVVSFGGTDTRLAEFRKLLERCAVSLRLGD
jgi:hypothetical protein